MINSLKSPTADGASDGMLPTTSCSLPSSSGISSLRLRAFLDDRQPMRLLPLGRLTATLKPIVSGATRATDGGNNLDGGILGNLFREGHGRNVSRKNKSAMPKIELAKRRQCRHNVFVMKLQSDINDYTIASNFYKVICDQSEASRERAVELREARQGAFAKKREAAENIIMSVLGEKSSALAAAGLKDFYNELAAGEHSTTILFQIADETVKAFK